MRPRGENVKGSKGLLRSKSMEYKRSFTMGKAREGRPNHRRMGPSSSAVVPSSCFYVAESEDAELEAEAPESTSGVERNDSDASAGATKALRDRTSSEFEVLDAEELTADGNRLSGFEVVGEDGEVVPVEKAGGSASLPARIQPKRVPALDMEIHGIPEDGFPSRSLKPNNRRSQTFAGDTARPRSPALALSEERTERVDCERSEQTCAVDDGEPAKTGSIPCPATDGKATNNVDDKDSSGATDNDSSSSAAVAPPLRSLSTSSKASASSEDAPYRRMSSNAEYIDDDIDALTKFRSNSEFFVAMPGSSGKLK